MYENKRLGFLFVLPFVLGVLLFAALAVPPPAAWSKKVAPC